jgi:hypothetical protein
VSDDEMEDGSFEGDEVPQSQVRRTWRKQYPNRPMPKIEAYNVPEKSFVKTVQRHREDGGNKAEMREYGRHVPMNKITGTVIKDESSNTYLILHRSNSAGSIHGTVRHEMRHIAEKESGKEYGEEVHSKVGGGDREVEMEAKNPRHRNHLSRKSGNPFNMNLNLPINDPMNAFFGSKKKSKSKSIFDLGF